MKVNYIFIFLLILLAFSCTTEKEMSEMKNLKNASNSWIQPSLDQALLESFVELEISTKNDGSSLRNEFASLDLEWGLKSIGENGVNCYTLSYKSANEYSFKNLIIYTNNEKANGYIFSYRANEYWAETTTGGMEDYTGQLDIYLLSGELYTSIYFKNGQTSSSLDKLSLPSTAGAGVACEADFTPGGWVGGPGGWSYTPAYIDIWCIPMGLEPNPNDDPSVSDPWGSDDKPRGGPDVGVVSEFQKRRECNLSATTEWRDGECVCKFGSDESGICRPVEECPFFPCCDEMGNEIPDCLENVPCYGDPIVGMQITSPGSSGINGGRYGCTRNGSGCAEDPTRKLHDGIDLTATMGTYVFSAISGTIVGVVDNFDAMQYKPESYGNYVEIETNMRDGSKIRMKYNHLDYLNVSVGQTVGVGMLLGRTGTTGNASSRGVTPHLHLQAKTNLGGSWSRANPEQFLATAWNENGEIAFDPCIGN